MGVLLVAMAISYGCSSQFYLSESDVAGYLESVRTADEANAHNFLGSLSGQTVRLNFHDDNGTLAIHQSNLLAVMRSVPNMYVLEQLFQQIRLDRLSTQVEATLQDWIVDSLHLLYKSSGARVRIDPLERVSCTFLSSPTVSYHSTRQSVSFSIRVRLEIRGTLRIRRLDGIARRMLGWAIRDGSYPVVIGIDDFSIAGDYTMPASADSRIIARFVPQPGTISIQGNLPNSMRDGAIALCRQKFSRPVHKTYSLRYDYFALSDLSIDSAGRLDLRYRSQPETSPAEVHVVSPGKDRRLYHTIGRSGRWQPYSEVSFAKNRYRSPAALVTSGTNQLELMAVTANGQFSYAAWRNGRWRDFYTSASGGAAGPYAASKPSLVATAAGQLEVLLVGKDGRLYHVRRLNGKWQPALPIPMPAYFNVSFPLLHPKAVQLSNRMVVVFVDNTMQPWGMVYDLETGLWSDPTQLTGPALAHPPALAASGYSGKAYMVTVAADGRVFARLLQAQIANITANARRNIVSGPLIDLGGHLTSGPTVICSGLGQLQLVGRGANNRLWHNQYRSPFTSAGGTIDGRQVQSGWQGWQEISDQFFGTLPGTIFDDQAVGLAATRQGQVHLIARNGGNSQRLVYNTFDSSRFGHAPWKAVHWRGLHAMPEGKFRAGPAIAVLDRQPHLVSRNSQSTLIITPLADDHAVHFAAVNNSLHPLRPDPVLLSTAPRTRDVLYPGLSDLIQHERQGNGTLRQRYILPGPGNTAFESQVSAVSLAMGDIDVVALGRNNTLYHWRFLQGRWRPPVSVASQVVSRPALVNVGAGRMELYAVKNDSKLHRWRFAEGQWVDKGIVNTAFNVMPLSFGPMSVSSWGEGIVDLALVEESASGSIYHRRLFTADSITISNSPRPTGPPRAVSNMAGRDPLLIAKGPDDLHLLMTASDGRLFASQTRLPTMAERTPPRRQPNGLMGFLSRVFGTAVDRSGGPRPLSWGQFQALSNRQSLLYCPGAKLGDGSLAVAAAAADGRLYLMRHNGHQWSLVMPLVNQQSADFQSTPLSRPALNMN